MWFLDPILCRERKASCARRRRRVAPRVRRLGAIVVCVVALWAGASDAWAKVDAGAFVPDLTTLALEGELPPLPGRVVLLDVWASWCAPCKASFPALSALQREFGSEGLVVIGVSVDRRERDFRAFVQRMRPGFAVLRDSNQQFAETFAPPVMPTTYLIDRQGRVRGVHTGFHGDRTIEAWRVKIRELLEESS